MLLHEGLGCIALWRDFPERLAQTVGRPVLAYARYGYGRSDVLAEGRREVAFMHDEAVEALPEVLATFGIERPLLVGHSDGASIALIHAGRFPGTPRGVVALAPHLFVEPVSLQSITDIAARFDASDLPDRMRRYHADPIRTFHGWSDIWLDPAFQHWNIEPEVAAIECPILAIQGTDDEYGTLEQVRRIRHLRPQAEIIEITGCRHSPQLDAPDTVLAAIARFTVGLS